MRKKIVFEFKNHEGDIISVKTFKKLSSDRWMFESTGSEYLRMYLNPTEFDIVYTYAVKAYIDHNTHLAEHGVDIGDVINRMDDLIKSIPDLDDPMDFSEEDL